MSQEVLNLLGLEWGSENARVTYVYIYIYWEDWKFKMPHSEKNPVPKHWVRRHWMYREATSTRLCWWRGKAEVGMPFQHELTNSGYNFFCWFNKNFPLSHKILQIDSLQCFLEFSQNVIAFFLLRSAKSPSQKTSGKIKEKKKRDIQFATATFKSIF